MVKSGVAEKKLETRDFLYACIDREERDPVVEGNPVHLPHFNILHRFQFRLNVSRKLFNHCFRFLLIC